jgi:hypothetical protein
MPECIACKTEAVYQQDGFYKCPKCGTFMHGPKFIPQNELEVALEKAYSKRVPVRDFLPILVKSDVAVPSGSEIKSDGRGFQPLLFDKEHVKMVACFTTMERIGSFVSLAPYCLVIKCGEFLRRVPPEYGVVVNPGQPVGFDMSPEGLRNIVRDFV